MIDWLDDFYGSPALRQTMMDAFLPAFTTYVSQAVGGPVAAGFVSSLAEAYVQHHLNSSRIQLQEVLKDADEPLKALADRFTEWEEKRPEKVARNELVRAANAANVQQMRERGVTRKVWRSSGGSCPYCTGLNGRTISIEEDFFTPDDEFTPEGAESPLTFTSKIGHPPVHQGCDCSIEAATETEVVGDPDTRSPEMVGWEDEIRTLNPKVEHGAIFDDAGKLVWSGSGKRQSVPFPADQVKRGYQITHLHPPHAGPGAQVLSSTDVALAIDRKLSRMRSFLATGEWMEVHLPPQEFGSQRFMFNFKQAMKTEERAYKQFSANLLGGAKPTKELQALLDAEYHAGYERAIRRAAEVVGIEVRTGRD